MPTKKPVYKVKKGISGLGLFATRDVKKGETIIEYKGEYIDDEEAARRGGKYLMEIDKNLNIDGKSRLNTARYINHGCKPNCKAESEGKRVFIVAKRNVKEGEEFTYDYGKVYYDDFIRPNGCKCGSGQCK